MPRIMPEQTSRVSFRFMVRSRWHDALLVTAIVALLVVGVWALWWGDVRRALHLGPGEGSSVAPAPAATDQT
jgi:hypothetical protein